MISSNWTVKQPNLLTTLLQVTTSTAGKLLAESILQWLAVTMNHQLGHRIAQHSAEAESWALLVADAAFSSVTPCTAVLATAAIALCTHKFSLVAWLSQVQSA